MSTSTVMEDMTLNPLEDDDFNDCSIMYESDSREELDKSFLSDEALVYIENVQQEASCIKKIVTTEKASNSSVVPNNLKRCNYLKYIMRLDALKSSNANGSRNTSQCLFDLPLTDSKSNDNLILKYFMIFKSVSIFLKTTKKFTIFIKAFRKEKPTLSIFNWRNKRKCFFFTPRMERYRVGECHFEARCVRVCCWRMRLCESRKPNNFSPNCLLFYHTPVLLAYY
jgi:hypothetical protein